MVGAVLGWAQKTVGEESGPACQSKISPKGSSLEVSFHWLQQRSYRSEPQKFHQDFCLDELAPMFTLSTEGLQDGPLPLEMMAVFLPQEHVLRCPGAVLTSEYESQHLANLLC